MDLARITSKGQTTIPKSIRERLGLHSGDVVQFSVEGERAIIRKVRPPRDDRDYLRGVDGTLDEWLSESDESAFRDL